MAKRICTTYTFVQFDPGTYMPVLMLSPISSEGIYLSPVKIRDVNTLGPRKGCSYSGVFTSKFLEIFCHFKRYKWYL